MMKIYGNKNAGYTLVELIVVIFIIGLIAGALVLNFKEADKQKRVTLAKDGIMSALRTAQNLSLSGQQIQASTCNRGKAAAAYWVQFSSNAYSIMAEDTCNNLIQLQRSNLVAQTVYQANPFKLTNTQGSVSTSSVLSIKFTPPFSNMTAANAASPTASDFIKFSEAEILIMHQDGSRPATITVSGLSGKIE